MSTVDPAAARRERFERHRGTTGAAVAAVFAGVLIIVTGAVAGFGFAGFLDTFRLMELNSVFSTWESQMSSPFVWLPIGIVASIFSWWLYSTWNHRYTGDRMRFAGVGPLTLLTAGLAGGVWIGCLSWTTPDQVGMQVDPTFGEHEPWGMGAWIFYSAQWWLPALFALFAVLFFLLGIGGRRRATRRRELVSRLIVSGRRVQGSVTESTVPSSEASQMIFSLTVTFTDLSGTDRWVKRVVRYRTTEVPPVGAPVTVLYDPSTPGDESRIFFTTGPASDPEDFLAHEF